MDITATVPRDGCGVDWYGDAGMGVARLVVSRGLALVYVIAFVVAIRQWPALLGDRGLLPVRRHLQRVSWKRSPTLLRIRCGDRWVVGASALGAFVGAAIVAGLVERAPIPVWIAAWLVMWAIYLSLVNAGQVFYGFGWETLLCEAGFLATFLGPRSVAPPVVILWLFRWLAFRVELGAGLIKLRGDACWRNLTCTRYHHETQPLPNPLSWRFHHLPNWMHRAEVLGNHVAQLVAPWLLFLPQPIAGIGAARDDRHPVLAAAVGQLLVAQPRDDRDRRRRAPRPRRRLDGEPDVVGGARPRRRRADRRVEHPPCAEPGEQPPGDERQLRPAAPGQHVRRVRSRDQAARRTDHRGHAPMP